MEFIPENFISSSARFVLADLAEEMPHVVSEHQRGSDALRALGAYACSHETEDVAVFRRAGRLWVKL
jgi:hypothetical protein